MGRRSCRVSCSFPRLSSSRGGRRGDEEKGGWKFCIFFFFFFFVHRTGGWTEMSKNNSSFVRFFFFFRRKEERAELSSLSSRLNEKLGEIKKIVGSVRLFENMVKNKKEKKSSRRYLADRSIDQDRLRGRVTKRNTGGAVTRNYL